MVRTLVFGLGGNMFWEKGPLWILQLRSVPVIIHYVLLQEPPDEVKPREDTPYVYACEGHFLLDFISYHLICLNKVCYLNIFKDKIIITGKV